MYFDTDAGGVVHNIVYLRFIETARTLLAIQMGMNFKEIERTGVHAVVTRTEIDYKSPARLGDVLGSEEAGFGRAACGPGRAEGSGSKAGATRRQTGFQECAFCQHGDRPHS